MRLKRKLAARKMALVVRTFDGLTFVCSFKLDQTLFIHHFLRKTCDSSHMYKHKESYSQEGYCHLDSVQLPLTILEQGYLTQDFKTIKGFLIF